VRGGESRVRQINSAHPLQGLQAMHALKGHMMMPTNTSGYRFKASVPYKASYLEITLEFHRAVLSGLTGYRCPEGSHD
jgi:hypothetical protein